MKECEKCKKEHDGDYASGRFCSKNCAASVATQSNKKEIYSKVGSSLKAFHAVKNACLLFMKKCEICENVYQTEVALASLKQDIEEQKLRSQLS